MSWLVLGLLVSAVVVVFAAEWPRLTARLRGTRLHGLAGAPKARRRRSHLVLIESEDLEELDEDREAFAESVERDLARLPTIDDRD